MNSKKRRAIAVALMLDNPLLLKKALESKGPHRDKSFLSHSSSKELPKFSIHMKAIEIPKLSLKEIQLRMAADSCIPTGLSKLDAFLGGGIPQGLTLIAGGPGCGKTTLVRQCVKNAGLENILFPEEFDFAEIYPKHSILFGSFNNGKPLEQQLLEKKKKVSQDEGMLICQKTIKFWKSNSNFINPKSVFASQADAQEWWKVADVIIGLNLGNFLNQQQNSGVSVDLLKNRNGSLGSITSVFKHRQLVQLF